MRTTPIRVAAGGRVHVRFLKHVLSTGVGEQGTVFNSVARVKSTRGTRASEWAPRSFEHTARQGCQAPGLTRMVVSAAHHHTGKHGRPRGEAWLRSYSVLRRRRIVRSIMGGLGGGRGICLSRREVAALDLGWRRRICWYYLRPSAEAQERESTVCRLTGRGGGPRSGSARRLAWGAETLELWRSVIAWGIWRLHSPAQARQARLHPRLRPLPAGHYLAAIGIAADVPSY